MVYQAKVTSISHNPTANTYSVKVRIPSLHRSSGSSSGISDGELPTCTVCGLPGMKPLYEKDDTVYVMFKDNNLDAPVIVGVAQNVGTKDRESDVKSRSFKASTSAELPVNSELLVESVPTAKGVVKSGKITKDNWKNLYNLVSPVQPTLEEHAGRLNYMESTPCYDLLKFLKELASRLDNIGMYNYEK